MPIIPNNESFEPDASGVIVTRRTAIFKKKMDSVLLGGFDITLDLPAGSTDCPDPSCRYNQTYDQYMGSTGGLCSTCMGKGKIYEHRQTIYKCNRRWENKPIDRALTGGQATEGGRVHANVCRVKTHIASFDHIMQSLGATLNGQKLKMIEEPRKTGWDGTNLYVISWWIRASKKNNG
jgi:hypothetical protein